MEKSEFRADLHCHSICSDGTDSPFQLLEKAKQASLSGLSITDHDTVEAYTPDFFAAAEALGLLILPGVELSSELKNATVHILGYGSGLLSAPFRAFLEEMQRRREERNRLILERLKSRKMAISEEELIEFAKPEGGKKSIGRPHIADLMVKKGYVDTRQQAFECYLREGGLCYAAGFKLTPKDAIEEMQKVGAKAVLAHPHYLKEGSFLRSLLSLPFDGIECYYGNLPKQMEARWLKIAKEKGWIATGGSDYHGAFKPYLSLGNSWVKEETFFLLRGALDA